MSAVLIPNDKAVQIEKVLVEGNLSALTPQDRVSYYKMVCESVGLNPLTKPFEYITLNGKLTLYARKDATDQLRNIHNVSVNIMAREVVEGCYVVTARGKLPSGREDESIGAVPIDSLKGEARANAMMKCETKAKRRVTLSICGLGMLDESEIETIPASRAKPPVETTTEDIPLPTKSAVSGNVATTESKGPVTTAEISYCSKAENASFFAEIRKALPAELKTMSEDWGRAFLKDKGYTKSDGGGSLQKVEKALFPEILREAITIIRGMHG